MRSISPTWSVTRCSSCWLSLDNSCDCASTCSVLSRSSFKQPRVLDGDDRLSGEVLNEFDLLVGEGANLLAVYAYDADQFAFLEQGYVEERPCSGFFNKLSKRWFAFNVNILISNIGNVLQSSGCSNPTQRIFGADIKDRAAVGDGARILTTRCT